jgi:PHD/YefM family antitoxin component YafN of YafNO toxin-antitoxin module
MKTITLNNAILDLPMIISSVIKNQEETVIATDDGAVIMVDQDNWNSIIETLRLLKDSKSLEALLQGHKDRDENKSNGKPINLVFDDL